MQEHVARRDLGLASPARAIPQLDAPALAAELATLGSDFAGVAGAPERGASLEDIVSYGVLFGMRRPGVLARATLLDQAFVAAAEA